ncbi:MAG: hypothetical protein ACE5IL_16585 [Myxococcota bacterium]
MITRAILTSALLGLAVLYYFGFGPAPTPSEWADLAWWRPRAFLVHSALTLGLSRLGSADPARTGWLAVSFFALLPLGLGCTAMRAARGAVARTLLLGVTLTAALLAAFGLRFVAGWSFFSWRFPWVILCTSVAVAAIALSPSLLEWLSRRRLRYRAAALIAAVLGIYLATTEITGWDPSLPANLSPWPVLTLFGLLLIGLRLTSLHLGAGLGSLLAAMRPGTLGRLLGAAVAAAIAAGLPWALSIDGGLRGAVAMGLAGALYGYWASARRRPSGALRASAGAILLAAITLSNAAGERNHEIARNVTAARVIQALDAYHDKRGAYPDQLEELVPEELPELPEPQIGWIRNRDDRFSYLNFGDSYTLEFPSIRWIQCSYSPPYRNPYEDEEEEEEESAAPLAPATGRAQAGGAGSAKDAASSEQGTELGGSWSCDSTPPKLF